MESQLPLGRWALFRNGEFFRLWGIGAVSSTIRWLELLAIGVVVFDLTGSPFQVALMAILRMLPLAIFGALVGALAGRLNHRKMLVTGLLVMIGVSAVLTALSKTGHIQLWHIAVGVFVSGMFWVLDYSVRKTLLGAAVDGDSVGHAMSLDTVSNNGTRMLGPILGGMFLQWVGLTGVYVFAAVGYIGAILCALALSPTIGRSKQIGRGVISAISQSLPLLKSHPLLAGILMVTVVFNLWGFPFISMIPVIGKEILMLNSCFTAITDVQDQRQYLTDAHDALVNGGQLIICIDMMKMEAILRDPSSNYHLIEVPNSGGEGSINISEQVDYDEFSQLCETVLSADFIADDGIVFERYQRRIVSRYTHVFEMVHLLKLCGFTVEGVFGDFYGKHVVNAAL